MSAKNMSRKHISGTARVNLTVNQRVVGSAYYFNNSSMFTSNTFEKATSSISVTNLFPHSIRCIAFLSTSSPDNCNLSAKILCAMFRFFLKIVI